MIRIIAWIALLGTISAGSAFAEPEIIKIKSAERAAKEKAAAAKIKKVDIRDIEDPAAQKTIKEILNYLGLGYQS